MKKRCLLPAILSLLLLLLPACSGGANGGPSADTGAYSSGGEGAPAPAPEPEGVAPPAGLPSSSTGSGVYADAESKLIRRAELNLQTTDFAAAVEALNTLVSEQEGYYESAEAQGGEYFDSSATRYGTYVVRVPSARYEAFMNAVGSVGYVVSRGESSTDVGQEYADTEARLATLKTKHERLLALLEQAATMEDIISLENALSECEYEIDQNSTALRRYDNLVGYATINVQLNEVLKIEEKPKEAVGFGARLSAAFSGGFQDFGRTLGNFAVWCAYHFVGVLLFLTVVTAVTVVLVKKYRKPGKAKAVPPTPTKDEPK